MSIIKNTLIYILLATNATNATKPLDKTLLIFYRCCMKAYLSASEFARLANVNRSTVIRWIERGIIKGAHV